MSRSGRAEQFMREWGQGHGGIHNRDHKSWGADDCAACTAEEFGPWEALVYAAEIMGWTTAEERAVRAERELAELRERLAAECVGNGGWGFGGMWIPGAVEVRQLAEIVGFDVPPAPDMTLTPEEIEDLRRAIARHHHGSAGSAAGEPT